MKQNFIKILKHGDLTPFERVKMLVHHREQKEKTGKGPLSDYDIRSLIDLWVPKNQYEVREYNRYVDLMELERAMKMDAYMYYLESENALLRAWMMIEYITNSNISLDAFITQKEILEPISDQESINFLFKHTYLEVCDDFEFDDFTKETYHDEIYGKRSIIPGKALYTSNKDISFVHEFKEYIHALIPLAHLFLIIKQQIGDVSYATLESFVDISKDFSGMFDIDLSQKYIAFRDDYDTKMMLSNVHLFIFFKNKLKELYEIHNWNYHFNIQSEVFGFGLISDNNPDEIIMMYQQKMKEYL